MKIFDTNFEINEENKLRLTEVGKHNYKLFIKYSFMFFVVAKIILMIKDIILRLIIS